MAKPEDPHKARINSLFKDRRRDQLGQPSAASEKTKGQSTLPKARHDRLR